MNSGWIINFLMPVYSAVMTAVMGYVVKLLKDQKKARSATADGTRCLLRVQLIEYHDKYLDEGTIPSYALENWNDMFKAYTELGVNGLIKRMDKEIQNLKMR